MLENLESSFGITQGLLQATIICGFLAVLVGTYWRVILAGLALLFVIHVFTYDKNGGNDPSPSISTSPSTQPIAALPPQQANAARQVHDEFMEDCMGIAANERDQCEEIWRETEPAHEWDTP